MLGSGSDNVYVTATNMSAWSRPGFLEPLNLIHEVTDANLQTAAPLSSDGSKTIKPGVTTITASPSRDVYEWDSATEAFVRNHQRAHHHRREHQRHRLRLRYRRVLLLRRRWCVYHRCRV